ncbi:hypothetical protein ABW19_dt0201698 [Dactylella cylindrospora]|nr:hypothetical protein ABW19_dt0201698 [Dactylella cylindrospora]
MCMKWATEALSYDVDMLRCFLAESKEYEKRLGERRKTLRDKIAQLAGFSAQAGTGFLVRSLILDGIQEGVAETINLISLLKNAGPKILLAAGFCINVIGVWDSGMALYTTMKERESCSEQQRKEIEAVRSAAVTLQGVWYISSQTYVFTTRTAVVDGRRVFLNQSDEELWRDLAQRARLSLDRPDYEVNINQLVEVITKIKGQLEREYGRLKDAVEQLQSAGATG